MLKMVKEIDVEKERAKYQAEYDAYVRQLNELDAQRVQLMQAIAERRGILIFLNSLDQQKKILVDKRGKGGGQNPNG